MESTPALDSPIPHHHDPSSLIEALEDEPTEVAPISLGQRLRQPRTILSIVVPLAIIGFFLYLNRERLAAVPELILQANPALVLLAFIVFYLGFPLRGYRWKRLLRRDRLRHQPAELGRDPVHLVVRQLRRAGQAR